jgi:hypothetical protein
MSKSLAPDVLRERVRDALRQAAKRYGDATTQEPCRRA